MKRRLLVSLLAVGMLLTVLAGTGFAAETEPEETEEQDPRKGTWGENITWQLDDYTLTVSGTGDMEDGCPWKEHIFHIDHVIFTGGITRIGADAFNGFERIETVDFGDSLVEIGERAFYGCEDIEIIHLPATFRTFGAEAFRNCYSLKYVYCDGGMPRFNDSCLWTGEYISVFYRTNNPWPAEYVGQLVSNFGGRLGVMMGNYEDSSVVNRSEETVAEEEPDEETTEATQEATEEMTEATEEATQAAVVETLAETEPVQTEAVVPETTEKATEATVPETQETLLPTEPQTQPAETEPSQPEEAPIEQLRSNSWIGMVLIGAVLAFVVIGAIIFQVAKKKGGRYSA